MSSPVLLDWVIKGGGAHPSLLLGQGSADLDLVRIADMSGILPLRCSVQTYAWGKVGNDSEVARLQSSGDETFRIEDETPYAELWMGTHPRAPSIVKTTDKPLSSHLAENPSMLGQKVRDKFDDQLPFLFKVLSVNKALSVQAHPSKEHAAELHALAPHHYPDNNHKPEMAIALTEFEGLCGFRPIAEIKYFIEEINELRAIVGEENVSALSAVVANGSDGRIKTALKECFSKLMLCDAGTVRQKLDSFINRIKAFDANGENYKRQCCDLLLRLNSQFPGDRGCFCIYFLNIMRLQPGEAMFLRANLPHAYLAGNCIECMACSDNVVRAGLTPKFIDVPTLCSMLDYSSKSPSANLYQPLDGPDQYTTVYNPPVPDFTVTRYALPLLSTFTLSPGDSGGILLVVGGQASSQHGKVRPGSIYFIAANDNFTVTDTSSDLLMFMAHCLL